MWKFVVLMLCLNGHCLAGPLGLKRNMPIGQQKPDNTLLSDKVAASKEDPNEVMIMSSLNLPSNATSIRAYITDGFSCENKTYGYYADVENDCQIFHVCLPVTYADGRENTFRWSFICPEDTIFSQDSFTCMRPDDMTITCEESYQYYELNRNFGVLESALDKENSNEANGEPVASSDTIFEESTQVEEEPEEKVMEPVKPVAAQKPVRRRPAISYAGTRRKPVNSYPLRKMPHTQIKLEVPEYPSEEERKEAKPAVQKFSKRPGPIAANSFRDRTESSKPESVLPTRTELFNQSRKRPTVLSKKPADQLEVGQAKEQSKIEHEQQNFSTIPADMSIPDGETQVADTDIEASETSHAFIKPENDNEISAAEPVPVLEAFEEIPAVMTEVVESLKAEEVETKNEDNLPVDSVEDANKTNFVREPQITEEFQSAEEMHTETEMQIKENQDETKTAEEIQAAEDSRHNVEETKDTAETTTALETHAADEETPEFHSFLRTSAEDSQIAEESKMPEEVQAAVEDETLEEVIAAEDVQNAPVIQVADENQNLPENHEFEKTKAFDKTQILEETKTAEEPQSAMVAEENSNPETAKETQVNEEEFSETQASLKTSAEETVNVEKITSAEDATSAQEEATDESQVAENVRSVDEIQDEKNISISPPEVQNVEETKQGEHVTQESEGSFSVEEAEPIVHGIEESQTMEEETESSDEANPNEKNIEPEAAAALQDPQLMRDETDEKSQEGNSEVSNPSIEQMEAEKPAEAPESMQTIEEMSHPSDMVQQMYQDTETSKETVNELKPVDPVMAHEAEQLIADFINTLRNNDFTNEAPGMRMQHHIDETAEEEEQKQQQKDASEVQSAETVEANENSQDENQKVEDELQQGQEEELVDHNDKKEEKKAEGEVVGAGEETKQEFAAVVAAEEQHKETNDVDALKPMETEKIIATDGEAVNLPQEMYQIPVQVINTPIEAEQTQEIAGPFSEMTTKTEVKAEAPAMTKDNYQPLSIDDIVELVKERLDQMPKTEMEAPMQLEQVLGEAQMDKVTEDKKEVVEEKEEKEEEEEQQQQLNDSAEKTVVPIYQRVAEPVQVEAAVQTDDVEQSANGQKVEVAETETDATEKTSRSYRTHSMLTPKLDPRKRRFLFKADLS